jgi:serine/threonine-protein phosphatase 2A regulatory subunit A
LLEDKIDSVKIKALESTPQIIKLIRDKNELEANMKGFFKLSEQKQKSWRVRYTIPEVFP